MILPNTSNTEEITTNFSIEMNASMFALLSKNVYNDVILAPIREWSCNAIDACIAAGVHPNFDVQLPTIPEPTFAVRDYGTGLSESDILGLFSVLGASTKRQSNAYNGTFGIGRMSGLAYSSSFTVESYYNATYYAYLITVKDGIPGHIKLSEYPTSEPNGLRLSLAVDARDISKFIDKATFIYSFFSTRPTTNVDLNYYTPSLSGSNWAIYPNLSGTYVVMANVPYKISCYGLNRTVINIPTGSVSITPGRESLTYDSATETYIDNLITTTKEDIRQTALAQAKLLPTPYEQLLAIRQANSSIYNLNLRPSDLGLSHLATDNSYIKSVNPAVQPMVLSKYSSRLIDAYSVSNLSDITHIFIQDIPTNFLSTALDAFSAVGADNCQLILRPYSNTKSSIEDLLANYKSFISSLGLSHIPVVLISNYVKATTKTTTSKLVQTTFQPSSIDNSKQSIINLETDSNTYYYFLEPPKDTQLYYYLEEMLNVKFIVLPKKVHSIISNYPNFIPVTDSLIQSMLDSKSFIVVDNELRTLNDLCYYVRSFKTNFFDFKSIYEYTKNLPYCWKTAINYISTNSAFKVKTEIYSHPVTTAHILSVYPELGTVYKSCYTERYLETYLSLKDQIYALHSASGLPSPTVPATSDYP